MKPFLEENVIERKSNLGIQYSMSKHDIRADQKKKKNTTKMKINRPTLGTF